jgi:hypothetical protein
MAKTWIHSVKGIMRQRFYLWWEQIMHCFINGGILGILDAIQTLTNPLKEEI